jgi:nucleotide-binding universal stress UspA family protein
MDRCSAVAHTGAVVVGLADEIEHNRELAWAAREAQLRNRPLRIVRAYHLTEAAVPWESSFDRTMSKELQRAAEQRVAAASAAVATEWPGVTVETSVVDGSPASVLREASASAEVTVLGSRKLSALGAAMLGSVSTVVAAAGSGPVVVVRGPAGDPAERPHVVVGVDGSDATAAVLDFAFDYASRHLRDLHAVFCWQPDLLAAMQWRGEPPPPDRAERWLAEAVAGWQDRYPDVSVHRAVVRAHPVAGLVAEAQAQELLVVGSRSRHARLATLLGSVSQGVLHHATCPVAVVHPR